MRDHLVAIVALALVGWAAALAWRAPSWPQAFAPQPDAPHCTQAPLFDMAAFHTAMPRFAHAVSAVVLKDGRLRAFWYEGAAELAPDVKIWSAVFDGSRWSAPRVVADSAMTSAASGRRIKSLGNALVYRDARGHLALLYASIAFGRWSGASLNLIRSQDEGESWSAPRHLITSPTLNFSTLVRSPAVAMAGGFTLVPAYQEFLRRYPEAILLDGDGNVVGRRRIDVRDGAIQPLIVALGARDAIAFSRTQGSGKVLVSDTSDAGQTWTSRPTSTIPNFDKPVAGARLDTGELLLIHNAPRPDEREKNGPFVLAFSADRGQTWRTFATIPLDRPGWVMHYPWLTAGADGTYHLLFTHSRGPSSELVHVRFNRAWIAQSGGPPCR